MRRRQFLKSAAGTIGGLAIVGPASASEPAKRGLGADRDFISPGLDGSVLTSGQLDAYFRVGANLWFYDAPDSLTEFTKVHEFLDRESARIILIRNYADFRTAQQSGKVGLVVGWQNSRALEEAFGNEWRNSLPPRTHLRAYYELGLRIANLCYNLANAFGGGCLDPTVSLSRAGAYLVGHMQEMGILVDCGGHTGEQTSLDIIRLAKRPVICSHSNVYALNANPRNTSDRVIAGIAATGGVFGVTAIDGFLTWGVKNKGNEASRAPVATVARFIDDIDYVARKFGVDHVALGADFYEGSVSDGFTIDPKNSFQYPFDMTYKQQVIQFVKGFERVDQLGNVRSELARRGYSSADISKIMGENWIRVFKAAWN